MAADARVFFGWVHDRDGATDTGAWLWGGDFTAPREVTATASGELQAGLPRRVVDFFDQPLSFKVAEPASNREKKDSALQLGAEGQFVWRTLDVPAADAWSALKNISKTHELFAGVLVDGKLEGDVRTVTFANGMVARERIVAIDDSRMRVAYAVLDMFEQHAASMRIAPVTSRQCRFVWISDFLPDAKAAIETVGKYADLASRAAASSARRVATAACRSGRS